MHKFAKKSLATIAILLGIGHLAFGAFVFKSFNLEAFWFSSFGLAMIVTAIANYRPSNDWIMIIQNVMTLIFTCALAYLAPQPQVMLGCILFAALFFLSFTNITASN